MGDLENQLIAKIDCNRLYSKCSLPSPQNFTKEVSDSPNAYPRQTYNCLGAISSKSSVKKQTICEKKKKEKELTSEQGKFKSSLVLLLSFT